jgi:UDP-N-acetylglucosamine 2-epimerase
MMTSYHLFSKLKNVKCIEPVSYLNMLKLEKNAKAILTDSGGVQKEAYWFKVPCLTLREETEWVETVKHGWNKLVGSNDKRIVKAVSQFTRKSLQRKPGIFGDGKAGEKIVRILKKQFG